METANRKLIRPNLNEAKEQIVSRRIQKPKTTPLDQTHAESFYYLKQMQNHTTMIVVLNDGAELTGWIEWYDKNCIKLNRTDAPNLLIFKQSIKYMFKEEELHARRRRRVSPARRPSE